MARWFAVILFGMTGFLCAAPAASTQHFDFPAGGVLHLDNSIGELTIEGWDRPDVEITTTKFAKREYSNPARDADLRLLDQVKISSSRHGDELVLKTDFPKHPAWERLFRGETDFELTYVIKAPRSARLVIDHQIGEVHVHDMTGDIHIADHMGEITLHLPEDRQYAIQASSKLGSITSDFPGSETRKRWLGSRFTGDASAAQKINLHIGSGDIVILKERKPQFPN